MILEVKLKYGDRVLSVSRHFKDGTPEASAENVRASGLEMVRSLTDINLEVIEFSIPPFKDTEKKIDHGNG